MTASRAPLGREAATSTLLSAALAGLLTVAAPACSSSTSSSDEPAGETAAHITSSTEVPGMTAEAFTAACDDRGGTVEVIPHCGGLNTCKGFSYDTSTQLLSEHTCKGAATCGGWNCVIDD